MYSVDTLPGRADTVCLAVAVIGALRALGQLADSAELTARRALGLSRRGLSLAVAAALLGLTALMVVNGETLGPWGQRSADGMKTAAKHTAIGRASCRERECQYV